MKYNSLLSLKKIITILLAMIMMFALIAACGNGDDEPPPRETREEPRTQENDDDDNDRELEVDVDDDINDEPVDVDENENNQEEQQFDIPSTFPRQENREGLFGIFDILLPYVEQGYTRDEIIEISPVEFTSGNPPFQYTFTYLGDTLVDEIRISPVRGGNLDIEVRWGRSTVEDGMLMENIVIDKDYWESYRVSGLDAAWRNLTYDYIVETVGAPGHIVKFFWLNSIPHYRMVWWDREGTSLIISKAIDGTLSSQPMISETHNPFL